MPSVVLAIDPAKVSGWAVFVDGKLCECGLAKTHADRVEAANLLYGGGHDVKRHVVAEKWSAGGHRGAAQMMGLGAGWGRWEAALEAVGFPTKKVVRVFSQTWRAKAIGGKQRPSIEWKEAALKVAKSHGYSGESHDVAEAICIGLWFLSTERLQPWT